MKFFLGTNLKMHRTNTETRQLWRSFSHSCANWISRRITSLSFHRSRRYNYAVTESGLPLKVGAQNVHWEDGVEATGEISARILAGIPVDLVEVGHSERRQNSAKLT